ncbi:MAG: UvrD-helicase domain-containing protein [Acidobacteriota bacterium]|nr:UvrD-helicase domain-containing protein [Acidobacteriota bacterium]
MNSDLVDKQSRDTIKTELACNQLVEAGAGSGKTQMMAERMAAGVASDAYDVRHMAAVTFTRKAAAELRGRFQLALERELKDAAGDAERAARVRAALSHIERFFAGTIHSFCAHLLRERPVEAGVSPGFTELGEVEDTRLRRQSWRDYRSQLKSAGDPLILEMLGIGAHPADLDSAFDTVCLYEEVEFPGGTAGVPDATAAWAKLDAFWAALQKKLPSRLDPATTCKTQQCAGRFRRQWGVAQMHRGEARTVVTLLETWDFEPKIVQYWWADEPAAKKKIAAEIKALHEPFRTEVVEPFLQAWRQYVYRLSVSLLSRARDYAAAERRRLNTLNYGDLLQLAAGVLRNNADVRRALADKYRWLFVDEFQDTDPVQAEIMFLLASDGNGADWRTVALRPGALFVVGDPKQSIYRFRRADIDIYNEVRARLEGMPNGKVVSLTSNFRSASELCELANDVFSTQFPATPSTHSPMFARLEPARTKLTGQHGLFTLTTPDTVDKSDIAAHEAAAMARFVQAEVAAGRRTYGDFLILLRKKKDMEVYARAFEDQQIPVEVSGAGAFGDSQEVLQLALLLRAIADPQDGVSLVGVLRGPLFGVSDRDLFAYKQAGGWFSIFAETPKSDQDAVGRVSSALSSLRQMHRWTQVMPIAAAVERMLERTGYLALAATTPGGVEAGDLIHAVDRIRSIVEDGFTLADAADALQPDADESSDVESLPLEPGREDVVRLMNLHKAKGLEAPVVFLANPCSGVSPRVDVRVVREADKAHGYFQIKREFGKGEKVVAEPAGWDQHHDDELLYIQAEEQRLLYVAATRAKDMLVISRWAKSAGGRRPWEVFDKFCGKATELAVPAIASPPVAQVVDLSKGAAAAAVTNAEQRHLHAMRASWAAATVSTETKHLPRPSPQVEADDPTGVITADTPSRRVDAGTAWGSLIHGLLEHALRHQDVTAADLRRLAMWMTMETPDLRPVIDDAVATVQAMSSKEFWAEAKASNECHEEVPFALKVAGDGAGVPKVINGTIDSVYRIGDGWKIVDYKTDIDVSPAMLQARYSDQLKAYADAWRRFTDGEVSSALVRTRE